MDSCIPRRALNLRLLHITLEGIVITRQKPEKPSVHEEFVTTKLLLIKNVALDLTRFRGQFSVFVAG